MGGLLVRERVGDAALVALTIMGEELRLRVGIRLLDRRSTSETPWMGVDILRGAAFGDRTTGGTTNGCGCVDCAASTAMPADGATAAENGFAEATHVGTGCFTERGFREAFPMGA